MALSPGTRIGFYEISSLLGTGGMGEVYRAHDSKLGRDIALKVLPPAIAADPERVGRFRREARAVAALKHPNLVTLYSAEEADGIQFLTMELIDGGTLAGTIPPGGFPLDRFFELALPLADALHSAHEKGITHRDLKPSNVMLDGDGRPKILDFGLAQIITEAAERDATLVLAGSTQKGMVLGTPGYMSPEQAEGRPLDTRTDIFSLGVILYELSTGRRPFRGDTSAQLISAVLRDAPQPIDEVNRKLPRHLARIVRRCLEKDPKNRFQTARDLFNDLHDLQEETRAERISREVAATVDRVTNRARRGWLIGAAAIAIAGTAAWLLLRPDSPRKSPEPVNANGLIRIVVLPMENLGSPDDAFFADGMTEELTSRLAVVEGLGVISRKSAMTYRGSAKTIKEIGSELDVDYALEGTVRWAKSAEQTRVRITQQLVRVSDDTHLWSQTYDRTLVDVFAIQTDIAQQVTAELGIALLAEDQALLASVPTSQPAAHELYLRALFLYESGQRDDLYRAAELLERAVALDPEFTLAYVLLSRSYALMVHYGYDASAERVEAARTAAERAVGISPDQAESYVAMGYFYYQALKQYEKALVEFSRAAAINPKDSDMLRGRALVLRRQSEWKEAMLSFEQALKLNPRDIVLVSDLADSYVSGSQWEDAERFLKLSIELRPDIDWLYAVYAILLMNRDGDLAAADAVLDRAPRQADLVVANFRIDVYVYEGNTQRAIDFVESLDQDVFPLGATARTRSLWIGLFRQLLGDEAAAGISLRSAEEQLKNLIATRPDSFRFQTALGIAYAAQGRVEDARRQARVALEVFPLSRDTTWGPFLEMDVAWIYAMVGDYEEGLKHAEIALSWPCHWTATTMRLNPWLRVLTEQPGFEEVSSRAERMRDSMFP